MYMNKYFFAMSDDDNQDWLQDMFEIFRQLPSQPRPQTPIMDEEILEIMTKMGMNVAEMQSVMRSEI
jgi:hypothetical protein